MNLKESEKLLQTNHKFIFIGEELYLGKQFLEGIKATLNPDFLMFNYIEVDQKAEAFEETMMKIESVPMMDSKKIVHIKNFNYAIDSNTWSKAEIKEFEQRLPSIPEDTVVIIANDEVKKAGNLGLYKSLSKLVCVIQLDRLNAPDLRGLLQGRFDASLGKSRLPKQILEEVIKLSGYLEKNSTVSLFDVEEMAIKIEGLFNENGTITQNDLYRLFEQKREADLFRLLNAIRDKDKKRAFFEYHLLRESGEPNIKIMVTLAKLLSTMVKSSYYMAEGHSTAEIAKALGKNPYAIESGTVFVRRFGRRKLIHIIDRIIEVDYQMKTGQIGEEVYGELALLGIFEVLEQE